MINLAAAPYHGGVFAEELLLDHQRSGRMVGMHNGLMKERVATNGLLHLLQSGVKSSHVSF